MKFEQSLYRELLRLMPDLVSKEQVKGYGKEWIVDLYSKECKIVMEACSRKVKLSEKAHLNVALHEKFHSMILKLIDIKNAEPNIKPVIIWKDFIPATNNDIELCNKYGIYVLNDITLPLIESIIKDVTPNEINKSALMFLARKGRTRIHTPKIIMKEQEEAIVHLLKQHPMTEHEISKRLNLPKNIVHSRLAKLLKEGKIVRLLQLTKMGSLYGTSKSQIDVIPTSTLLNITGYNTAKSIIRKRVINILEKHGRLSTEKIDEHLGYIGYNTTLGILVSLRKKGYVKMIPTSRHTYWELIKSNSSNNPTLKFKHGITLPVPIELYKREFTTSTGEEEAVYYREMGEANETYEE